MVLFGWVEFIQMEIGQALTSGDLPRKQPHVPQPFEILTVTACKSSLAFSGLVANKPWGGFRGGYYGLD